MHFKFNLSLVTHSSSFSPLPFINCFTIQSYLTRTTNFNKHHSHFTIIIIIIIIINFTFSKVGRPCSYCTVPATASALSENFAFIACMELLSLFLTIYVVGVV